MWSRTDRVCFSINNHFRCERKKSSKWITGSRTLNSPSRLSSCLSTRGQCTDHLVMKHLLKEMYSNYVPSKNLCLIMILGTEMRPWNPILKNCISGKDLVMSCDTEKWSVFVHILLLARKDFRNWLFSKLHHDKKIHQFLPCRLKYNQYPLWGVSVEVERVLDQYSSTYLIQVLLLMLPLLMDCKFDYAYVYRLVTKRSTTTKTSG